MTRDEFMKELAYLLQDIQDEDKDDAVQYYTAYSIICQHKKFKRFCYIFLSLFRNNLPISQT